MTLESGGRPMVPYGERSRFEEALREKGPPFLPDEWGGNFTPLEETVASSHRRHSTTKSVGRRRRHRSPPAPPADPWDGRTSLMLRIDELKRLPRRPASFSWSAPATPGRSGGRPRRTRSGSRTASPVAASGREWRSRCCSARLGAQGRFLDRRRGADASGNERSVPIAKAMDDVLVAYGQNVSASPGERLSAPAHRSGWEGNVNVNGCGASRWSTGRT